MRCDLLRRVSWLWSQGCSCRATLFTQQKSSQADSARLSSVKGSVTVERPGGGAIPAQVNTPLEEGVEVSTAAGSSANVRMGDASTIELDESTKAELTQLGTGPNGARQNIVTLGAGYARFRLAPDKQESYKVLVADATLSAENRADFLAAFDEGKVKVRVLGGSVTVSAHDGSMTLGKGRVIEYVPADEAGVPKSHARVVRLSYPSGTVTLKRMASKEDEKALLNTPIQEGFELSTGVASYAEVEFENGSTARIGEQSKLLFTELALDAHGNKLNGMALERGYGTFNFLPQRQPRSQRSSNGATRFEPNNQDVYSVKLADASVRAEGACEFRTDLNEERYRVEVFKGLVEVAKNQESWRLAKGSVMVHESNSAVLASNTSKGITKDAWDQWTEARDQQALLTYRDEPVHASGASYGWSDLNTYGEWIMLPTGRFGWTPYATAGWSPFSHGMWQMYPGMGWTWVSADPWGWVTDHCGMWEFDDFSGWYWINPLFGCGSWWPSLVNWYAGPGWIGWAPGRPAPAPPHLPRHGPSPRPIHPVPQMIKVPTSVVANRQLISSEKVTYAPATAGSRIEQPPFEPVPRTASESSSAAATSTRAPTVAAGPRFGFTRTTAPTTILTGGDAARESLLLAHHGFHSAHEPLRSAQGTTLGGTYAVQGSRGEFRGSAGSGGGWTGHGGEGGRAGSAPVISRGSGGSGIGVASHGSSGGGGAASGGGGFNSTSAGGGGHSGGGYSGGGGGHSSGGGGAASGGGASSAGGSGGGGHH